MYKSNLVWDVGGMCSVTACYGVGEVHCTARLRPDDNKLLSVDNGFILSPNLKSDSERAFIPGEGG